MKTLKTIVKWYAIGFIASYCITLMFIFICVSLDIFSMNDVAQFTLGWLES